MPETKKRARGEASSEVAGPASPGAVLNGRETENGSGEVKVETLMRRMAPQSVADEDVTVSSAVMCHIMVLNSVLERTANRLAESHGMTFPQWMAIGCIGHAGPEGITHSELGNRLMLSKAPITGLVDRLERAGYVQRNIDTRDRRVSRVVMTELGEAMWRAVRQTMRDHSHSLSGTLAVGEQELLLALLSRLLNAAASTDPTVDDSLWMPCVQKHNAQTEVQENDE